MSHDQSEKVLIVLAESDYAALIQLLDTRIRSERARAAAFKARRDHSNQIVASGRMSQILDLRNAVASGCRLELDNA